MKRMTWSQAIEAMVSNKAATLISAGLDREMAMGIAKKLIEQDPVKLTGYLPKMGEAPVEKAYLDIAPVSAPSFQGKGSGKVFSGRGAMTDLVSKDDIQALVKIHSEFQVRTEGLANLIAILTAE